MLTLKNTRRFSIIVFIGGLVALPIVLLYTQKYQPLIQQTQTPPQIISPILVPVYKGQRIVEETFPVASPSAIYIMDRQSGSILYQRNSHDLRYPASTSKMMTAIVARKLYPLEKVLQVKEEAFALGSAAHFRIGEQLTVQNLLYALLLPSGNDAAFVLANHHPFGYEGFVDEMNKMGKELHLDKTNFQNPSGLDVEQQETTARDLAILANELMKDSVLRQVVGTGQITFTDVTGKISHKLATTHELLGVIPGVVGVKTGTTESAGENLVTEVDRDGHQILIVLLGSQNRYNETNAIIRWLFTNYEWREVSTPSVQ